MHVINAQLNYTTTKKELLAVVFALEKFRPYVLGSKIIVYMNHAALKYLLSKKEAKLRLIRWILLLQEFNLEIKDKKGSDNLVAEWRDETARSSILHGLVSKIIPNLPIWWFNSELRGIMVNKGRIHREIRKFMMFSLKLIKSDDKSMVEIGENGILWKITSNCFHGIKNHRNWSWFRGELDDQSGKKFLNV